MLTTQKRDLPVTSPTSNKRSKIVCTFKEKCYRRNPHHFREYDHPHLEVLLKQYNEGKLKIPQDYAEEEIILQQLEIIRDLRKSVDEVWSNFGQASTSRASTSTLSSRKDLLYKESFAEKLFKNEPYNLFFTTIPDSPETEYQLNSIKLTDLLCPSLGVLESSLQINFMIDIIWLLEQYKLTNNHKKPLTILYGEDFPKMKEYMAKFLPNVTPHFVKMQDPFGTHHSKMGLYYYADRSIRIHIGTANLYHEDWNVYCQAVWVSPLCPALPANSPDTDGVGPTGFKNSLIQYLKHYQAPCLNEWIRRVKRADFSSIKVFLVSSVPGKHGSTSYSGHLNQVGDLLSRHCSLPDQNQAAGEDGPLSWHIIAQASSIGNLGQTPAAWLRGGMLRSLASHKKHKLPMNSNAKLSIIFPSKKNVMNSYKGTDGGGCLPYSKTTHEKQKWLETYLHEWKADVMKRTRAMPHVKSYCRMSPCYTKLAWFLLTSANISKAAWGSLNKDLTSYVRSYELGVLFIPSFFDEEYFYIKKDEKNKKQNIFPVIYDLPLVPYDSTDKPWCM